MNEMQNCGCLELEERVSKAEESLQNRNKEFESLKEELRKLKESDEDSLFEQMMVNKALEVEKHMAENRADEWKIKFEKLAETVRRLVEIGAYRVQELELDEDVKLGLELASVKFPVEKKKTQSLSREGLISGCSPLITTPVKDCVSGRNRDDMSSRRRVNKMLVFEGIGEEECEDEDVEASEVDTNTTLSGRKRKHVISDSENDDDDDEDNIPIATLKNLKPQNQEMSDLAVDTPSTGEKRQRRVSSRLSKQRQISTERLVGIPITGDAEDDDETEEESESESLDGFIVPDDSATEETNDTEGDAPEEETDYADVISRLRRDKKPGNKKWKYEADMLADFGKDHELCMRAVCVLYRFQTEGEKATRSTIVSNGRGFSIFDAERGTRIGQFLTDGDPECVLKKSVEELRNYSYDAVEICRDLAGRYSKQLFQIYNNREDPYFAAPPSP